MTYFLYYFFTPPPLKPTMSSYHSLFSCIVSLYTLILLCSPHVFLKLLSSPLLVSTLVLLLALLRLGTSQQQQQQQQQPNINPAEGASTPRQVITQNDLETKLEPEPEHELNKVETGPMQEHNVVKARSKIEPGPKPEHETCDPGESAEILDSFANHDPEKEKSRAGWESLDWAEPEPELGPKGFLDWDVGAPLEVIYEAHEGEEEGEESQNDAFCKAGIIKRYPSLSRYYPESDSGSDSDSYSYSSSSLDEEEREGLIEIALDDYGYNFGDKKMVNMLVKHKSGDHKTVYHNFDDEDNLIEIDISPTKNMSDYPW